MVYILIFFNLSDSRNSEFGPAGGWGGGGGREGAPRWKNATRPAKGQSGPAVGSVNDKDFHRSIDMLVYDLYEFSHVG